MLFLFTFGSCLGLPLRVGGAHAYALALSLFQMVRTDVMRLDYISCLLTILSTIFVGRKLWYGWVIAAVNSVIICVIGLHTGQFGFVPANLFCLALYAWNLRSWTRA